MCVFIWINQRFENKPDHLFLVRAGLDGNCSGCFRQRMA